MRVTIETGPGPDGHTHKGFVDTGNMAGWLEPENNHSHAIHRNQCSINSGHKHEILIPEIPAPRFTRAHAPPIRGMTYPEGYLEE